MNRPQLTAISAAAATTIAQVRSDTERSAPQPRTAARSPAMTTSVHSTR